MSCDNLLWHCIYVNCLKMTIFFVINLQNKKLLKFLETFKNENQEVVFNHPAFFFLDLTNLM